MARSAWKRRSIKAASYALPLLWLCLPGPVFAQLFTVDAGQGMAGQPSGGVVGVDFGTWTTEASLGIYNSSVVGGAVARKQLNPTWGVAAGDQTFQIGIPTQMQFSSQVLARGLSATYNPSPKLAVTTFAGVAGNGYFSSNLFYSAPDIPLGAVSVDYYLDNPRRIMLFTRALASNRQTLLGGLLYQAKELQTGFSVGVASNEPHAEGILRYAGSHWDIRERYVLSGQHFELLTLPQFSTAQENGQNLDLSWLPTKGSALHIGQHGYLEPSEPVTSTVSATASTTFQRGTMESAGGLFSVRHVSLGGDVYQSRFDGAYGSAASVFSSQKLSRRFFFNENYYRPLHAQQVASTLVLTAGENLNRRVTLTEFATRANGQWTLNYGGGLHWDRFDVNLSYSTNYVPLAAAGGRFQQSTDVNGHMNIGRFQVGVNTYVQPDGKVLYGYEIKTFYLHPMSNGRLHAPSSVAPDFPQFLIEGRVNLNDSGKPVANAPVVLAGEVVYTDEAGGFSLRVSRRRPYKVRVMTDQPIEGQYYAPVRATSDVMAGTDDAPGEVNLSVRLDGSRTGSSPKEGLVVAAR